MTELTLKDLMEDLLLPGMMVIPVFIGRKRPFCPGHSLSLVSIELSLSIQLSARTDFLMYDNVVNESWKNFLLAPIPCSSESKPAQLARAFVTPLWLSGCLARPSPSVHKNELEGTF